MREITTELKIDKQGRIVIPEIYRQELGIEPGQLVRITISNPKKND
jgi:AbrB family looped-hinge helix DNA binding protein